MWTDPAAGGEDSRLGFSTLGCPGWTLEHAVAGARAYGYDAVEVRPLDDEVITPDIIAADADRIRRARECSGVELVFGSSARFSASDQVTRGANEATATPLIELARELGVPVIRVFGGYRREGVSLEAAIDNVAASLNRLAPIAEDAGVVLAIETHDRFGR